MPTTNLVLNYLSSGQAQKETVLNANSDTLDSLVFRKTGDTITRAAVTSGTPATMLKVTAAADTGLTASTELNDVQFDCSATRQFATGALTNQRAVLINGPTYSFVGASTITNAATLHVVGEPVAGTNATITNGAALWVQGKVMFGANITGTSKAGFTFAQTQQPTQPTAIYVAPQIGATMTASTEAIDVYWKLGRTITFATGAITTQRQVVIEAPTLAFAGASVVTTAATLAVTGAPVQGANATLTNTYSLWCQAGTARFDGNPVFSLGTTDTTALGAFYGRCPVNVPGVGTRYIALYS